jgi:8-oxo-dGTP pyrophosphatase MutT (NUDIX family)
MRTKYVLMVVMNPALTHVVGLTKLKGPSFLIGKTCFPGGRVDPGESELETAVREMKEETGLDIPAERWTKAAYLMREDAEMTTFVAVSDQLFDARQCEEEPVFVLEASFDAIAAAPDQYAPDFAETLELAKAILNGEPAPTAS